MAVDARKPPAYVSAPTLTLAQTVGKPQSVQRIQTAEESQTAVIMRLDCVIAKMVQQLAGCVRLTSLIPVPLRVVPMVESAIVLEVAHVHIHTQEPSVKL